MENDIIMLNEKRKRDSFDYVEIPVKKKRKKSSLKKIAPPTAEEMNRLRETENIFHSNLFRLQIEELLKEVKMKESTCSKITLWIEKLKNFLLNMEFSFSILKGEPINVPNVLFPIRNKVKNMEVNFEFLKPKSVDVFGSYCIDCVMKRFGTIDIVVEMPKEMFHKEDYLNERYIVTRNIYLSCLASKLAEPLDEALVDHDIQFIVTNSIDKPLLRLKPVSEKLQKYCVYIHVIPESTIFKETRFLPSLNNIRYGWYFETAGDGKLNSPTPYYNSIICQDLVILKNEEMRKNVFMENSNFKDAFLLLKVWLRQRQLCEGLGSFSGFLLSMFIVYLYKIRKLNKLMSSYQIIRTVWLWLEQSNWHSEGISLANVATEYMSDHKKIFISNYEVVFVDVTGNANLASVLSLPKYLQVKAESKYAVQCLDNSKMNSFPALFMTPVLPTFEFDHMIYLSKYSIIKKIVKEYTTPQMQLDFRNNIVIQFLKIIIEMLERALGNRILKMYYAVSPAILSWAVNKKIPRCQNIIIGLKVNVEHAYNVIDKGPTANLPEAAEFRKFWGSKSELRRFKDGNVCETVCWGKSNDSLQKKRLIIRDIVDYIFENKFKIKREEYLYIADQLESVIFDDYNMIFESNGTGEEACLNVLNAFNDLSIIFRQLKDLPLEITSTQGTSAVFRYSDPFPSLPNAHSTIRKGLTCSETATVFKNDITTKHVPLFVSPVQAVIKFSISSKWPDNLDAIRRLQGAFYLKLSSVLKNSYQYVCHPYSDHVDILKDGYVFRIQISNHNEISAVKRQFDSDGTVQYCDNAESLHLEKTLVQLPTLTSAIHGLHQQYPALGPACMISKRWLRSQLIDEYCFPDVCLELLISHLFLTSAPYTVTYQPQTMFMRFLKLLSAINWYIDPVIVNFNDKLSREDILEIDVTVSKQRGLLPALVIVTPFDKSGIVWTREEPSCTILKRLAQLAQAAIHIIEQSLFISDCRNQIKAIFRPPLKGYDILIWTIPTVNSLRWMAVDVDLNTLTQIKNFPKYEKLPILDFHPIRSYVEELRKHYSQHCLFFYDFYGGNFIGVVLKPETKFVKEYKISNISCSFETNKKLKFNIEAMIDDFHILGSGIVSRIEQCSENT